MQGQEKLKPTTSLASRKKVAIVSLLSLVLTSWAVFAFLFVFAFAPMFRAPVTNLNFSLTNTNDPPRTPAHFTIRNKAAEKIGVEKNAGNSTITLTAKWDGPCGHNTTGSCGPDQGDDTSAVCIDNFKIALVNSLGDTLYEGREPATNGMPPGSGAGCSRPECVDTCGSSFEHAITIDTPDRQEYPLTLYVYALSCSGLSSCPATAVIQFNAACTDTANDVNGDGIFDLADAVALLEHLYEGNPAACPENGDANGDGILDLSDSLEMLNQLYAGG
ncbi:MAG: dockerin type I repeat-containing protein [Patescibacteria group bacterium]|nr:dockerin type I repeat-containing protein [Patescibacteria group bacterium]